MKISKAATGFALSGLIAVSAAAGSRFSQDLNADPASIAASDTTEALSRAFRRATERAQPSLVHVRVQKQFSRATAQRSQPQQPRLQQGSGSGFLFRADGYVLTNNHVVEDGTQITVVLNDGREYEAKLVGRDPNTDVAVVKIEGKDFPRAVIGDADRVEVGDWVVALGYPLQLGPTVTAGIVSAKGRSLGIIARNEDAQAPLEHFIQTDAAINPGNSGGPLVDLQGRVIAMNTAIASPTGYYSGYGFAVPINLVMRVANDLIEHGVVHRPRIGVAVSDVNQVDAEVYKLPDTRGAEVTQVNPGSPADRAGIKLGDVITAVDGTRVKDSGALTELLARQEPGETVTLSLYRYGEVKSVKVELGMFSTAQRIERSPATSSASDAGRLGFTVTTNNDDVVIANVDPGSTAARSGLAPGLVLERINGREVNNSADAKAAVAGVRAGGAVSLVVRDREGTRTIINFRAPE